jgi:putative DNA primase/helicase
LTEVLAAAHDAAERGWSVVRAFGLRRVDGLLLCSCQAGAECPSPGKHPSIADWPNAATTDPAVIDRWFASGEANLGLATGPDSGVWVLDIDPKHGGTTSLEQLQDEYGPLPDTVTAVTGSGGLHLYWQWPDGMNVPSNAGQLAPGVDLRGTSGFLILPPSQHACGQTYGWADGLSPDEVNVAEAPEWLLERIQSLAGQRGRRRALLPLAEGSRNDGMVQRAGRLRALGLDGDEIAERLLVINRTETDGDPLPESEVLGIAARAENWPKGTPSGGSHGAVVAGPSTLPLTDHGHLQRLIARYGDELCHIRRASRDDNTVETLDEGYWVYSGARWRHDPKGAGDRVASLTTVLAQEAALEPDLKRAKVLDAEALALQNAPRIKRVLDYGAITSQMGRDAGDFDRQPMLLNVQNGTLDLSTGQLRGFDRADLLTQQAPVLYDPRAECPAWLGFLNGIFEGDQDIVDFLRRSIGYCLTGLTTDHKVWFLSGPGGNGKSTFVNALLDAVFGKSYATEAPTEIVEWQGHDTHPASLMTLNRVRFACTNEVPVNATFHEARIKQISGGDYIPARGMRENWGFIRPSAKLWIRANHLPVLKDIGPSMTRRLVRVPFKVRYEGANDDKTLGHKLLAEGPGILNWALSGCLDWQMSSGLVVPKAVKAATTEYFDDQDGLSEFYAAKCEFNAAYSVTKTALYEAFRVWSLADGEPEPLSKRSFGVKVKDGAARRSIGEANNGDTRRWTGVRLTE